MSHTRREPLLRSSARALPALRCLSPGGPCAVPLLCSCWDFTDSSCWYIRPLLGGTGGPPSLQHGLVTRQRSLPSQAPLIREQGSWNGLDRIVLHLLRPSNHIPAPLCRRAQHSSPSASPPAPTPHIAKPRKSTKLSRSDGRGQNSI